MSAQSPTSEGFRLIFRRPAIPFAEIAWRWSVAAAVWFLGTMFLFEYANSLPVTRLERLMLSTNQPALILRAIHRIFEGSAFRFTKAGILLSLALTFAWIVLASLGRAATVKALMGDFGIAASDGGRFSSLIFLNSLRAAVTLAAIVAGLGSVLLASSLWASTRASVADAGRLCIALIFFVALVWAALNWLLSTAAISVMTGKTRALDAVAATVRLCQKRTGPVLAVGTWFGLAHFGSFIAALMAGFIVLGAAGTLRGGAVLFLEFVIVIAYCAVADFLYAGRLAAYVFIIRGPGEDALEPVQPTSLSLATIDFSPVDRDELILSDLPLPAS
jgi:hypothetical protein